MLYHVSIHRPKPEHEPDVIDSMHRFSEVARRQEGLLEVHTLKDRRGDALLGFAVWESADALKAARPALAEVTEDDDFDAWETEPIQVFLLDEV
jgi:heme-degrading monooxygenase HmoA